MTEALGHIDRICFDFDGVLYTPPPGQNIFECANNVMGEAFFEACHRRVPLKDCITMAHDGHVPDEGNRVSIFTDWAEKNGIEDIPAFRKNLFDLFHQQLLERTIQNHPTLFVPNPTLQNLFNQLNLRNGIATHGSIEHWVRPIQERIRLGSHFLNYALFGLDDNDFKPKSKCPSLVGKCLSALGEGNGRRGFVEDTAINLKTNKDHYPDLVTIFLHHGKPFERLPAYISHQFKDLTEMKRALIAAQQDARQIILI
ncbi:MAG: hypothetical protein KDJ26_07515 [Alphaproteobacteria bacterium]|nr:hypothetical protein [Alphaproteobacteria bacterium]